jgi:hypothetical protein
MMDLFHDVPWSREHFERTHPNVADCLYLIEANSYETHKLWEDYSDQGRRDPPTKKVAKWSSGIGGPAITVGKLDQRPVVLSMMVREIEGIPVCFIDACSQVVDHIMIDLFLDIVMPGVQRTNASNFHHFLNRIDELQAVIARRRERDDLEQAAPPGIIRSAPSL